MEEKEDSEVIQKRKNKLKKFFFGWVEDNYDKAFLAVVAIAFILRLLVFLGTIDQAVWYDGASYLATAKKWGLGLSNVNDVWYYRRGFFWPLFCSIFFRLGLGETGVRFSILLFSTAFVICSYFLIKTMFNKKLAFMVSICLSFSWVLLFFTGRTLTEIPSATFLLIALLFFWKGYVLNQGKKYLLFFGLFIALSLLTRMQSAMFVLPFLIFAFTKEKFRFLKNKHLWISVGIFFLFFLPYLILYYNHYGNPVKDILAHYFGVKLETEAGSVNDLTFLTIFDYFKDLPYDLSRPIFILFIIGFFYFFLELFLGFDKIFKDENLQKKLFVFSWIVIPMLILGYMTAYVEQRYYISALPFLFLIVSIALLKIESLLIKLFKISKKLSLIIITIFLILLLVFPNINAFPSTKSNLIWAKELIDMKKTSYLEVKESGLWIKENSNPNDIVLSNSGPYINYYAEREMHTIVDISDRYNETLFDENVQKIKPRFYILSIFEDHQPWMYAYPEKHPGFLVPVKVYNQGQQPVLVVYEFNYSVWNNPI